MPAEAGLTDERSLSWRERVDTGTGGGGGRGRGGEGTTTGDGFGVLSLSLFFGLCLFMAGNVTASGARDAAPEATD